MDKKNTIIGILMIIGAFGLMFWQASLVQEQEQEMVSEQQETRELAREPLPAEAPEIREAPAAYQESIFSAEEVVSPAPAAASDEPGLFTVETAEEIAVPLEAARSGDESLYVIANDYIRVTFTTQGGAIKKVEFIGRAADGRLQYPATLGSDEPYAFNDMADRPALSIALSTPEGQPIPYDPNFRMVNQTGTTIQFAYTSPEGGTIIRGYEVPTADQEIDPYVITHATRFINKTESPLNLSRLYVNLGSAPPTEGDIWREYVNFGYFDGRKSKFIKIKELTGSKGFLGFFSKTEQPYYPLPSQKEDVPSNIVWASVKNQFFAAVLTPDSQTLGSGIFMRLVDFGPSIEDPTMREGLTGSLEFNLGRIPSGEEKVVRMSYYVGPKEYTRLQSLGQQQDLVMQFGFFGMISKILLVIMIGVHSMLVPVAPLWAWGFTIILVTVLIKLCLWPLTQVQVRSAKRMAKIQQPMKELREKYKDNPQRMQQETMKLFREHKVNPAAGCLPLLIQIPIFIALFYMLRTASELRFAPFLWIQDLSVSDTLTHIAGFPLNPLPIMMAFSMFFQMRMTPMPTADNFQRTLFQFMPFIFLIFCYNFPAGLVLYWTCQNLLTILQQWLTNRRKDEEPALEIAAATPAKSGGGKAGKGARKKN